MQDDPSPDSIQEIDSREEEEGLPRRVHNEIFCRSPWIVHEEEHECAERKAEKESGDRKQEKDSLSFLVERIGFNLCFQHGIKGTVLMHIHPKNDKGKEAFPSLPGDDTDGPRDKDQGSGEKHMDVQVLLFRKEGIEEQSRDHSY
jgi:hypothetical protein